jgi:hypothetical protein
LPVVLYGCETWSLTVREEHKLRVFENRLLRRIFGPTRHEVTGGWRQLHNEELRDLYSSTRRIRIIKSKRMRWAGNVAEWRIRGRSIHYRQERTKGKSPLGRPRIFWRIIFRWIF